MVVDSNGYISGYTNYRIIFASFLKFQKAKSSRSQQKRIEPCERELVHGIAKPPRYKIEVLMESFARLECEKKKKRRSMSGIS